MFCKLLFGMPSAEMVYPLRLDTRGYGDPGASRPAPLLVTNGLRGPQIGVQNSINSTIIALMVQYSDPEWHIWGIDIGLHLGCPFGTPSRSLLGHGCAHAHCYKGNSSTCGQPATLPNGYGQVYMGSGMAPFRSPFRVHMDPSGVMSRY